MWNLLQARGTTVSSSVNWTRQIGQSRSWSNKRDLKLSTSYNATFSPFWFRLWLNRICLKKINPNISSKNISTISVGSFENSLSVDHHDWPPRPDLMHNNTKIIQHINAMRNKNIAASAIIAPSQSNKHTKAFTKLSLVIHESSLEAHQLLESNSGA